MAEASIDVDRVVREVLAQLGLAPDTDAFAADSATPPQPETGEELVVSCRVVTLSDVEGRLEVVRRLVVPARAVITPAVRDELHRKSVALVYAPPVTTRPGGQLRLVLVTAGQRFDPTPLVSALGNQGIEVDQHRADCLIAATDQLAGELVQPHTLGLLLTRHTAAGLCLANRHPGVRAVLGTEVRAVSVAAASVGANLLVVDPAGGSFFQLKQIVTEFCRGGTRECPDVFRERLG